MKKRFCKYPQLLLALSGAVVFLAITTKAAAQTPLSGKTLQNLQAAYSGEKNAQTRYMAFAQKAEQEGYGQVASLFRAAARAEQIHEMNHAAVIRAMSAEPAGIAEFPVVNSTRENLLAAANRGEAYERDTMYPRFIEQASAEDNRDAIQTFEFARRAEAQHFNLFAAAVKNLENMRGTNHTYFVCTVCGYTTYEPVTANCVSCSSPAEKYEAVT